MCGWLCPRVVEEPWPGCHGANVMDFDFFWGGPGTNGAPALRTLGVDVALFFGSDSWKYEWPVLFDI